MNIIYHLFYTSYTIVSLKISFGKVFEITEIGNSLILMFSKELEMMIF
jgi:hypothetical protein